jgi:hypothetical protein
MGSAPERPVGGGRAKGSVREGLDIAMADETVVD